jgi:AraC-like DNA-binding protein
LSKLFKVSADELTDSCLDIAQLGGEHNREIIRRATELDNLPDINVLLEEWLRKSLAINNRFGDPVTDHAVSQILSSAGNITLTELRQQLGITERSLERKFREHVGIPAKLFSRICRFQGTVKQLKNDQYEKLSDIAYDNGYSDQSHFIRSFKTFAGCAPNEYLSQSPQVIDSFAPGNFQPVL